MRVLLKVHLDTAAASEAVKDGSLPQLMKSAMEQLKPEAAYFLPENGLRTALLFFDLEDPAELPVIVEPFFRAVNAKIECTPAMNFDDVMTGMQKAAASAGATGSAQ